MRGKLFAIVCMLVIFPGVSHGQDDSNQVFTVARIDETETLDPQGTTTISSSEIDNLVYDTLVALDDQMVPVPSLASWTVSDDGLKYTFELQDGITFHSGDSLTATDVKFTLDRWLANERSPTSYTVNAITEIEVVDENTVTIQLDKPYVLLLTALASPYASILNEDFVQEVGDTYGTSPETTDGTGPYILSSWQRQDKMVLDRNEAYSWGPPHLENHGPANFSQVVWRIIPEDTTRIAELEAGNVQFTAQVPELEVEILEQLPDVQIIRYDDPNTTFIGFKMGKAILEDGKVRKAINYALDREELVVGAYAGLATPAYNPVSPLLPFTSPSATESGYRYDPEQAANLLTEAGWVDGDGDGIREKDGKPLSILFMYSPQTSTDNLIPLVQEQLAEVGIGVTPQQLEWTAYLEALRAGEHEMMLMSVRYVNEDGMLYFYLDSEQRPAPNRFDFVDAEVDEWLQISRTSLDEQARTEAYEDIQMRAIETAVFAPLVHEQRAVAASPELVIDIHPFYVLYKLLDAHFE